MIAIAFLFVRMQCDCFKSRWRLEVEILVLRHQLNVLQQCAPRQVHLRWPIVTVTGSTVSSTPVVRVQPLADRAVAQPEHHAFADRGDQRRSA